MRRIFAALFVALITVSAATAAYAACQDGKTSVCRIGNCPGTRECVGGHILGCEVDPACRNRNPTRRPVDYVAVNQVVPGQELGILLQGVGAGAARSALATPTGTSATFAVGSIAGPANGAHVIAFARSRQPQIMPASFTPGSDLIGLWLDNNLRFNMTFWILGGSFSNQQTLAQAAVTAVNNAYTTERSGIRIGWLTVNDATGNPKAASLLDRTAQSASDYTTAIGFAPGEINVYVIHSINGSTGMGVSFDGLPVTLLASGVLTFPQVLEHEIGHDFVLWHVDQSPGFNFENVMWPTVTAHFLTEGQNFRMNFHPSSQLNALGLRPGQPTFVCNEAATPECPANNRRLWPDGSLPPN